MSTSTSKSTTATFSNADRRHGTRSNSDRQVVSRSSRSDRAALKQAGRKIEQMRDRFYLYLLLGAAIGAVIGVAITANDARIFASVNMALSVDEVIGELIYMGLACAALGAVVALWAMSDAVRRLREEQARILKKNPGLSLQRSSSTRRSRRTC